MAGKWHNTVVQVLRELCDEWVKNGLYKKVYDGNSDPIPISYRKQTYYYQPDLYAVYSKNEKVDIFEVIDTETEGEAVMDIVYSALTPRINVLCVVCSDNSKLEAIRQHARIILNKIFDEEKKSYNHIFRSKYFVYVPRTAKSAQAIKRLLKTQLEF
ncbi:MAG: hypothetical protein QXJ31_02680 [Candidatus Bathyarchaeia archaeon]